MSKCPKCDFERKAEDKECPECGVIYDIYNYYITQKKINEEQERGLVICSNCGAVVQKGLSSCPSCKALLWYLPLSSSHKMRLEKIRNYNYGQLLLRERGYIFEKIYSEQDLDNQIRYFSLYSFLFSCIYGFFLGMYARNLQLLAASVKIPLLLFGTLGLCLPALYVLNILMGTKLTFKQTLAMLLASTYLISVLLASLSPILLFFIFLTISKKFISILNIIIFFISGVFGIKLLWYGMRYLTIRNDYHPRIPVMKVWSVIYIAVGTQLAWILRPFIGEKEKFAIFREIEENFYVAVINMISNLFK